MDKIIYYTDELNDEFSDAKITPRVIDGSYVYVYKSLWKKFTHFFWLRIIAHPIAFCYLKFKYHHKFINKKVIKPYKRDAYFLYGNHTHNLCDAFIPPKISGWTDAHVIVNPENVSVTSDTGELSGTTVGSVTKRANTLHIVVSCPNHGITSASTLKMYTNAGGLSHFDAEIY